VKSESKTYKGRNEIKPFIEKSKNYSSIKDKNYLYGKSEQLCNCGLSHTILDLNKNNNNKSQIGSKYIKTEKENEVEKKKNNGGINEIKYQISMKDQKDDKQKTRVYSENRYNRVNDIKDREKSEPRFNNYHFQTKKYEKEKICICGKDHEISLYGLDDHKSKIEVSRGRRGISEKQEEKRKIDDENNLRRRYIEIQKKSNICLCGKDHGISVYRLDDYKSRIEVSRGRRGISEKQEEKKKLDDEKNIRKRNIEVQTKRKICICGKEHGICTCGIDEICLYGKTHGIYGSDDALKRKKDEEKTKKLLEEYRRKREEESKRKKEEEKREKLRLEKEEVERKIKEREKKEKQLEKEEKLKQKKLEEEIKKKQEENQKKTEEMKKKISDNIKEE
jgi:hypothetical protein